MTTRWFRGADVDRSRERADDFDPVAEGNQHGLTAAVSLEIWERVCRESTDGYGGRDEQLARQRFHQVAMRVAARGGQIRPAPGKLTRYEAETWGTAYDGDVFADTAPGRTTRVMADARRWERQMRNAGVSPNDAEPLYQREVNALLASMSCDSLAKEPAQVTPLDASVGAQMSRLLDFDVTGVEVVRESPHATGSTKAVTKDGAVHFRAGTYQPGTPEGDWLIAHELAHVVQQRSGRGERTGTRRELEREADRAATLAAQGRAAPIVLRAQPTATYAFSEDESHDVKLDEVADYQSNRHTDVAGGDDAKTDAPADATAKTDTTEADDNAMADHRATADDAGDDTGYNVPDAGEEAVAAVAVIPAEESAADEPGGGGGAAAKPPKTAPDVGGSKPEIGLSQLRGAQPDKMGLLFEQLHITASADAAKARAAQRANPPKQMSTSAAAAPKAAKPKDATSPATGDPKAAGDLKVADDPKAAGDPKATKDAPDHPIKAEVPGAEATKQAKQREAAAQRDAITQVVDAVKQSIASWFSAWSGHGEKDSDEAKAAKMSETETQQMAGAVDKLPTTAADISTEPGPAPDLAMKGEAKESTDKDRSDLENTTTTLETLGRADSRAPMGEDHIAPTSTPEELTARPPRSSAASAAPEAALPTVASAAASEEVGIVAQEQHGPEIDAALAKASADVTTERAKEAQAESQARSDADTQVRELKAKAGADQAATRTAAQADVQQARRQWQAEIDKKGADARRQGDKKVAEGMAQVEAQETKANADARQHLDEGKQKADEEKQKGEKAAADAKTQGKSRSSGFWGWVSSKAKAAFDGIKKAVSAAIDACRRAVKAVIAAAKKLAMAVIDLARKVIVAVIQAVGKALLAISDALLSAFPALKARFQNALRNIVDKAVAAVNKLADGLKQAVQKALDLLGATLDKALQLLEKGIHAIIDAANAVVQGAIKAAQAIVEALGTWAKLLKDVVTGPGAWIGKLGAAIVDGIKNHLWSAFKTAVVEWFKSKVFELLGIGGIILELLLEGGLTRDHIIQMALDALIVAIPAALVAILIEKLVSMIVPAAGAVMAIIEGLQAAWGTISRIIAAFAAFMAFLLAVKSGSAGPLFATVLAGAAIVVLDFVSTWLLRKLASAARKVGARLKGLAAKFKRQRKTKGKLAAGSSKKHHDDPNAKSSKKRQHEHDGSDANKHTDHDDHAPNERDKKKEQDKQKHLADAARAIRPKLAALIAKQPSKLRVRAQLAAWKVQHRLTDLRMEDHGEQVTFTAKVNPKEKVGKAIDPAGAALFRAKQRAQQAVTAEIEARRSSIDLANEFDADRRRGRALELPTAEDQVRFAGVL